MATREEIKKIIGYLKLVFPNYNPDVTSTPNTVDVYEDLLGDLDGKMLEDAVREACKQDRAFAPSPGEIIAAYNKLPRFYDPFESFKKYLEDKNGNQKRLNNPE